MIFFIIGLLIIVVTLKNYKKGFYYFLFFKVCLVTNITVISLPGIPFLSLDFFMTLIFIILYYKDCNRIAIEKKSFPYKNPFVILSVSYFLSTVFAYVGFQSAFSQYVGQVVGEFLFAWLMWKVVDKKDIGYIIKGLSFMFFLSCIYAFFEKVTQTNPIQAYEMTLVQDSSRVIDFLVTDDANRGYRVQSFFEHAIGAGLNWCMYIILFFSLVIEYKYKLKSKLPLVTAILCIPCVFFANARGPIVFLLIGMLCFVDLKNKSFYKALIVGFILFLIFSPLFSDYTDNILSIFNQKAQDKVGGSNAEMRFEQLGASIALMMKSPIVGLGYKFMNELNSPLVSQLLGLESMWFRILTQFGLLGLIANVILAYYSLVKVPKLYKSKSLFFFSLAYWVTASLTSVPGFLMYLYYLILIIFIKQSNIYQIKSERAALTA